MKHRIAGYHLNRSTNERGRLFTQLVTSLVIRGEIRTTRAKAGAVQHLAEKLVTLAKQKKSTTTQALHRYVADREVRKNLTDEIVPKLFDRNGGYTRIISLGERGGDKAQIVLLQWSFMGKKIEKSDKQSKQKTAPTIKQRLKIEKPAKKTTQKKEKKK